MKNILCSLLLLVAMNINVSAADKSFCACDDTVVPVDTLQVTDSLSAAKKDFTPKFEKNIF